MLCQILYQSLPCFKNTDLFQNALAMGLFWPSISYLYMYVSCMSRNNAGAEVGQHETYKYDIGGQNRFSEIEWMFQYLVCFG